MEDIICQRCGSINDFHTERAGPHIKAICNSCERYIKFIKQHEPDMSECSGRDCNAPVVQVIKAGGKEYPLCQAHLNKLNEILNVQ